MSLKRFPLVAVRRRESNRIHVLASALRTIRPDLVTLLKLTLLPTVLYAAAGPPGIGAKVKIAADFSDPELPQTNDKWKEYVKIQTPSKTEYKYKCSRGRAHQKGFPKLGYDDINDRFIQITGTKSDPIITVIPHIEMPLGLVERHGSLDADEPEEEQYQIRIVDNQNNAYVLKFPDGRERRERWYHALKRHKDDNDKYTRFWRWILFGEDLDSGDDFEHEITEFSPRDRRIFVLMFQNLRRHAGGRLDWTNVGDIFQRLERKKQELVKHYIGALFAESQKDKHTEAILKLWADIQNYGEHFFGDKEYLVNTFSDLWEDPEIWLDLFFPILKKKIRNSCPDHHNMDAEDWLKAALGSTVAFLNEAMEIIFRANKATRYDKKCEILHEVETHAWREIGRQMTTRFHKMSDENKKIYKTEKFQLQKRELFIKHRGYFEELKEIHLEPYRWIIVRPERLRYPEDASSDEKVNNPEDASSDEKEESSSAVDPHRQGGNSI